MMPLLRVALSVTAISVLIGGGIVAGPTAANAASVNASLAVPSYPVTREVTTSNTNVYIADDPDSNPLYYGRNATALTLSVDAAAGLGVTSLRYTVAKLGAGAQASGTVPLSSSNVLTVPVAGSNYGIDDHVVVTLTGTAPSKAPGGSASGYKLTITATLTIVALTATQPSYSMPEDTLTNSLERNEYVISGTTAVAIGDTLTIHGPAVGWFNNNSACSGEHCTIYAWLNDDPEGQSGLTWTTANNGTDLVIALAPGTRLRTGANTLRFDTEGGLDGQSWSAVTTTLFNGTPPAVSLGTPKPGNSAVALAWTAPAQRSGVQYYNVRTYSGGRLLATKNVGNTTTSTISGLTNGMPYQFSVAGVNRNGVGTYTPLSLAVTPRTEFVAPTVTKVTPLAGASGVSRTASVTATFSEAVTGLSVNTAKITNTATGAVVTESLSYSATTRTVTLDPTTTLTAQTSYTVTLLGGATTIRDIAGNPLATKTWTFKTGS